MLSKGPYKPTEHEQKIYRLWEDGKFFMPNQKAKEVFSMVLPPPNVTGVLHLGHALAITIEDLMTRYNRMQGKKTLWLPGTDHAAIATQSKVEKLLYKENKTSRYDLGREKFLQKVDEFAKKSHDTIIAQAKRMGASCDWTKEAFTLDKTRTKAVRTAFKQMYDNGLIYRGDRVVNWDPKGQTTISDDEVVHVERQATLYTFRYAKDFPFTIATTRPETKLGDTAVAVHPSDKRYQQYIGKQYLFEFCGQPVTVKVIADEAVDPKFGTGALGVTPAHSHIDWEMAIKNDVPLKQVIDEHGRMVAINEQLKGKKVEEARQIIIDWLKKENLLEKEETVKQNVATAERTGALVEPLPKKQWFINVNQEFKLKKSNLKNIKAGEIVTLKKLMRSVIESGEIKIMPAHFKKIYYHWIDNLRDWCISRQIWYGHQIPVWYKGNEICVDIEEPQGEGWQQDSDTLDTWFSSGLWTFSTLGWPEQTEDLKTFHPTTVLETGYDILFFWVARMILMTTYLLGEIPFKYVYLHGLIRDEDKKKMSKSSGNAVDPLGVMDDYGTDALRMALVFSTGQGSDVVITEDKIMAQKKFANKIWNASKFVLMNLNGFDIKSEKELSAQDFDNRDDQEILKKLNETIKNTTANIDKFMFHQAAQDVYHFFWHDFCDVYLEVVKERLKGETEQQTKEQAQQVLYYVLLNSLKLLHPFMPFITETIYQALPVKSQPALIIDSWPLTKNT